jgi:hypothetical protein
MKPNRCILPTKLVATASAIAIFASSTSLLKADDTVKVEVKDGTTKKETVKKWQCAVTAGVTLTRGNSRNFLATIGAAAKRTWTHDELLLGANAGYGQTRPKGSDTDQTTDSYINGSAQWNHSFTVQLYGGLLVTGNHDDVAQLSYRVTVNPLAGYYFVKQTNATFAVEAGPSYVSEHYRPPNPPENYIGLRVGERADYTFKSGAKVWQSLGWIPQVTDFNNYLVTFEAGVSAPISKAFSVSLILQDIYKSQVPDTTQNNDFKLIAGLTYNF